MSEEEGTGASPVPDTRIKRLKGIAWRIVDEEAVLVNVKKDEVIHLDPVASFIWSKMDGQASMQEIADAVVEEFEVDLETALADSMEFARRLLEQGAAEVADLE
jgi:methyltransferase-like protein